ncbi:MAG: DUF493 domain-containing protein [Candidatus Cloacimonadota bacterium]|nr:MAG: DUF493 domain-containing protein [Candidatus Cloacimonadota bacterium]PIE78193.1 MAG: DUF493 domain-containing protein [Candidatus Delongbacteria bacterium]
MKEKPKIDYPCEWSYTIITTDSDGMMKEVENLLGGKEYILTLSKKSSKGKYTSYNLTIMVKDEEERNSYFQGLQSINLIKFLI